MKSDQVLKEFSILRANYCGPIKLFLSFSVAILQSSNIEIALPRNSPGNSDG